MGGEKFNVAVRGHQRAEMEFSKKSHTLTKLANVRGFTLRYRRASCCT